MFFGKTVCGGFEGRPMFPKLFKAAVSRILLWVISFSDYCFIDAAIDNVFGSQIVWRFVIEAVLELDNGHGFEYNAGVGLNRHCCRCRFCFFFKFLQCQKDRFCTLSLQEPGINMQNIDGTRFS